MILVERTFWPLVVVGATSGSPASGQAVTAIDEAHLWTAGDAGQAPREQVFFVPDDERGRNLHRAAPSTIRILSLVRSCPDAQLAGRPFRFLMTSG